jgi:hypothetical protein
MTTLAQAAKQMLAIIQREHAGAAIEGLSAHLDDDGVIDAIADLSDGGMVAVSYEMPIPLDETDFDHEAAERLFGAILNGMHDAG